MNLIFLIVGSICRGLLLALIVIELVENRRLREISILLSLLVILQSSMTFIAEQAQ